MHLTNAFIGINSQLNFCQYLFELPWNKDLVLFYIEWICYLLNVGKKREDQVIFLCDMSDKIKLSLIHYDL